MKQGIHPQYFDKSKITCACGNKFEAGSTFEKIDTDVCSKCHPFFTGQTKFVDIKGRIDKFNEKVQNAKKAKEAKTSPKKSK